VGVKVAFLGGRDMEGRLGVLQEFLVVNSQSSWNRTEIATLPLILSQTVCSAFSNADAEPYHYVISPRPRFAALSPQFHGPGRRPRSKLGWTS
jgi:hypothetical protein